ncbi:alanine/glycine:cation symporter family protein [Burkholderia ubonensis]|uniref:alanine/glycine:cation symporter family protein n=1 Tax=Burkholderia ubonensis TaxID=101571 RepID=UPI0007595CE2|nr:alanine/glycine:cation symporter family protein [Burkholderia ubonensis]KVT53813.1 sodium:alanine symporter [Burkholderia ubonensis]
MNQLVDTVNGIVWSPALIFLCLAAGLYFSVRTRFAQVRHFVEMLRLMRAGKASDAGISSFQALALSLSGRVGTGNIAGVATAITFGGPGALLWMWVVAFFGASTAFIESTLSQIYKERRDGQYRGGPAYYIERGIGCRWYAAIFAIATVIACGLLLPGVQANGISAAVENSFGIAKPVTGAIIVLLLGLIIFGGVKRIARITEIVVPFMALGYILIAGVVIALNIQQLPGVIVLVFKSALGLEAGFGAVLGLAVQWGVKRGVYSNEAGQGTGPHASAAAEVKHPAQQGLVQAFSVYVDTLFLCTATGFMILLSGAYNVVAPTGDKLFSGAAGIEAGPGYTQLAIESALPGFGAAFVALALFFFAFTTILAYYYIAETNVAYLSRGRSAAAWTFLLRGGILVATLYGAVKSASVAWGLGDIGVGLMAWLNLVAIFLLQKPALSALRDFEAQRRAGKPLTYNPAEHGVRNATFWEGSNSRPAETESESAGVVARQRQS